MDQRAIYEVVISVNAQTKLKRIFSAYIIKYFSEDRAFQVFNSILETVNDLEKFPKRGQLEERLKPDYRYILHRESRLFELKVIYRINEENLSVLIVDFFPTISNPKFLGNI